MNEEITRMLEIREELAAMAAQHLDFTVRVDQEGDHSKADCLLCELLLLHGESDAVTNFRALRKWYA